MNLLKNSKWNIVIKWKKNNCRDLIYTYETENSPKR